MQAKFAQNLFPPVSAISALNPAGFFSTLAAL
jgi:hypothetical protein